MAGGEGFQRHGSEAAAGVGAPAVRVVSQPAGARAGRGRGQASLQPDTGAEECFRGKPLHIWLLKQHKNCNLETGTLDTGFVTKVHLLTLHEEVLIKQSVREVSLMPTLGFISNLDQ